MTTPAQLSANRRNAKKSTGPKTAAGRAVASRNALRHGLTADQLVVQEEEAGDFVSFHDELRAALQPADAVEEQLVERIVLCSWRLRRVCRAEAGITGRMVQQWMGNDPEPAYAGVVFIMAMPQMLALSRYERSIERSLHRALEALDRRQEGWRLQATLARREEERMAPPEKAADLPPLTLCNPADPFDHRNYRSEEERAEIARTLQATRRLAIGLPSESWAPQK